MAKNPSKNNNLDLDGDGQSGVVVEKKVVARKPSLYRVFLVNDDYTPMDFVIEVLQKFFRKDHTAATEIMLSVHNKGKGECGVFPYEIAEIKVAQVSEYARQREYPLKCTMEKA